MDSDIAWGERGEGSLPVAAAALIHFFSDESLLAGIHRTPFFTFI